MILGLTILIGGALALIPLENWMHHNFGGAAKGLAEHVYLPLLRVLVIIGFLWAIYPTPLMAGQLVEPGHVAAAPLKSLLNWLFLLSLLLVLLPEAQVFSGLLVPVQALTGAWLLASHHAAAQAQRLVLEDGGARLMLFAALVFASHLLIRAGAAALRRRWGLDGLTAYDAVALALQPPLVLVVSWGWRWA